jgi:mRNA-degrading endonuclease RelE of RelBE toxin-antitoxin system
MLQVRFLPPAAKFIKKLKDKKLKDLYKKAIDEICEDYTMGEEKVSEMTIYILGQTPLNFGSLYGRGL